MLGFMSGLNLMKSETGKQYFDLGTSSRDEQWAYLLEACRRNPSQDVSYAVANIVVEKMRVIRAR